jgi:hypothetical protein
MSIEPQFDNFCISSNKNMKGRKSNETLKSHNMG